MYFGVQGFLEHFAASFSSLVLGFWMSDLYDATHNVILVRFLGIIGGVFTLSTAILFYFVPLKENVLSSESPA